VARLGTAGAVGWRDMDRPYVLLSCAMSLDGYLDDASDQRLVLSGAADLDQVDELRAGCDAILVGAGTVRADNPRLLLRSPARREARASRGAALDPVRVVISGRGELDPAARLFTSGSGERLVYVNSARVGAAIGRLGDVADVIDGGDPVELARVLADLAGRGIGRLMVEGGTSVLTEFLVSGLADELRLAIAPFFVGDSRAPRFTGDGRFPWCASHPARLVSADRAGDVAVLTYALPR
jgi:5-amino-6-(5-phosphoribosylamino)uracil reductase